MDIRSRTASARTLIRQRLAVLLCAAMPALAGAQEVIELKTIAIIGNRELPKTLVIVPWKAAEPTPVPAPQLDSLLDEPAQPLDSSSLQRRVDLFQAGFVID